MVNTSFMMGGALGLAVLASLAAARTSALVAAGAATAPALTGGYQLAFGAGAAFAALAAAVGVLRIRRAGANHGVDARQEPFNVSTTDPTSLEP